MDTLDQPIDSPEVPEEPAEPAKPRKPRKPDPDGSTWHREATERWSKAVSRNPEAPIEEYDAPPLPAWSAPAIVARELFGRYLLDRDTGLVHDVQNAVEECWIDSIFNATFYHFESELPESANDHAACMEA